MFFLNTNRSNVALANNTCYWASWYSGVAVIAVAFTTSRVQVTTTTLQAKKTVVLCKNCVSRRNTGLLTASIRSVVCC